MTTSFLCRLARRAGRYLVRLARRALLTGLTLVAGYYLLRIARRHLERAAYVEICARVDSLALRIDPTARAIDRPTVQD